MVAGRPSLSYQGLITLGSTLMIWSLLTSLAGFWKMKTPSTEVLLLSMAMVGASWLLWRAPRLALALIAAAGAGAAVAAYYLPAWTSYFQALNREWLPFWEHLRTFDLNTTFGPNLGFLFLALTGLGFGLLVVLETLIEGTTFWSITGGAAVFATEWLWYYDKSATTFMGYATCAFALWILAQAAKRDTAWIKAGRRVGYRSHVATPMAVVLVAAISASVLPANFSTINLGVLGDRFMETFPVFKQLRGGGGGVGPGRFSLRTTGFSPIMGTLGGPVKLDNSIALSLTTEASLQDTVYLRGASFYTYNGQTWVAEDPQLISVPKDADLPTSYGPDVLRDYVKFEITPELNLGGTIFTQLEPMRVENLKGPYKSDTDGNLWTDRSIPKGTTYLVNSRVPRYSAEQIRNVASAASADSQMPYKTIPATVPRRVGDKAREISAGKAHPYDQALAIEEFLRGMKYDLEVLVSPSGRDFVDYFLFDLRRGYCTYYATAMAVMLRELEIPTRLVEGFAVPASTKSTLNTAGKPVYEVRNTQAHAWVEAYFPGYGWVTFDPTPRSDLPLIDRSTPAPDPTGLSPSTNTGETPDMPGNPAAGDRKRNLDPGDDGSFGSTIPTGEWPWALTALLSVGAVIFLGMRRLQRQDRIAATGPREVVKEAWDKADSLMTRFDFGRKPDHTAQEYARQLAKDWPSLREPAGQVAADYTTARYAPPGRPVAPEAAGRAREFWNTVREALISRYGWRLYLWNRVKWVGLKLRRSGKK